VAPGGFNPAFDLMEINATAPADDEKVLHTLWNDWNAGHHYYLSAGTDTHDVWRFESGAVRTFVHIDGVVTAKAFAQALKDGHGYVTFGPLIYPSVIFGDELKVKPGEPFTLSFDLQSVAGVKQVELIGAGVALKTESFPTASQQVHVDFPLSTRSHTWYSLIVEDNQGHKAYTDPIWVDAIGFNVPNGRSCAASESPLDPIDQAPSERRDARICNGPKPKNMHDRSNPSSRAPICSRRAVRERAPRVSAEALHRHRSRREPCLLRRR
jgi:hypothetical protein